MSTVLASLLIGNGYDAYCVSGTAPRWVTQRDTSCQPCPYVEPTFPEAEAPGMDVTGGSDGGGGSESKDGGGGGGASRGKYNPEPRPPLESRFLASLEERRRRDEAAAARAQDGADLAERLAKQRLEEEERRGGADDDALAGRRLHCWVLVRAGRRGVDSHVFVEPSTGRCFPVEDAPYDCIESVWNHRNYWVNMQCRFLLPEVIVPVATRPATALARPPTRGRTAAAAASSSAADAGADASVPPTTLARTHFVRHRPGTAASASVGAAPALMTTTSAASLDLSNAANWEYVFIETLVLRSGGDADKADDGGGGDTTMDDVLGLSFDASKVTAGDAGRTRSGAGDDAADTSHEHILDLPKSWVPKLEIARDLVLQRCVEGVCGVASCRCAALSCTHCAHTLLPPCTCLNSLLPPCTCLNSLLPHAHVSSLCLSCSHCAHTLSPLSMHMSQLSASRVLGLPAPHPLPLHVGGILAAAVSVAEVALHRCRYYAFGCQTTWYHKAKLERCAPFVHKEGLVARLSLYEDVLRTQVVVSPFVPAVVARVCPRRSCLSASLVSVHVARVSVACLRLRLRLRLSAHVPVCCLVCSAWWRCSSPAATCF
jgi:hypothetical protein